MRWKRCRRGMPDVPERGGRAIPEAVVFDIGGVLLDWDPRHLYRKLFSDPVEMEWFLEHVCTPDWHREHDRGVEIRASCRTLAACFPQFRSAIEAWAERGEEMIRGPVPGSVEILVELHARGTALYALTNMERETYPIRRARYPFFSYFQGVVVSGQERLLKPDPPLFERLLARFSLSPPRTLFIDDRPDNIQAAAALGFSTHLFTDAATLRRHLVEAGLLP